jgi:hypothetical protein
MDIPITPSLPAPLKGEGILGGLYFQSSTETAARGTGRDAGATGTSCGLGRGKKLQKAQGRRLGH